MAFRQRCAGHIVPWPLTLAALGLLQEPSYAISLFGIGRFYEQQPDDCAPLKNAGSHYTVEVAVGTPPQKFDLVADTGSASLLIPSCLCQKCQSGGRCFRGNGKSSSFLSDGVSSRGSEIVELAFDSGQVWAALTTDIARVTEADVDVLMNHSLLIAVDHEPDLPPPPAEGRLFEGVLGLGVSHGTFS
eukprot:TRINITY_DN34759_c0_g1_i2.p1 TRINITY_DN34759_c0_g1~~TRINITY_DN34759_c0_g1_i2.p1  ORF type:complete len:188 (-),score=17.71 TRINITY_DN34759_c0_g1_i2:986-1549(-)